MASFELCSSAHCSSHIAILLFLEHIHLSLARARVCAVAACLASHDWLLLIHLGLSSNVIL